MSAIDMIEEALASKGCTIWGRSWNVKDPEQRTEAAEWLEREIHDLGVSYVGELTTEQCLRADAEAERYKLMHRCGELEVELARANQRIKELSDAPRTYPYSRQEPTLQSSTKHADGVMWYSSSVAESLRQDLIFAEETIATIAQERAWRHWSLTLDQQLLVERCLAKHGNRVDTFTVGRRDLPA